MMSFYSLVTLLIATVAYLASNVAGAQTVTYTSPSITQQSITYNFQIIYNYANKNGYQVLVNFDTTSPNYSNLAYMILHTVTDSTTALNNQLTPAQASAQSPATYWYNIPTPQNSITIGFTIGVKMGNSVTQADTPNYVFKASDVTVGSTSSPTASTPASPTTGAAATSAAPTTQKAATTATPTTVATTAATTSSAPTTTTRPTSTSVPTTQASVTTSPASTSAPATTTSSPTSTSAPTTTAAAATSAAPTATSAPTTTAKPATTAAAAALTTAPAATSTVSPTTSSSGFSYTSSTVSIAGISFTWSIVNNYGGTVSGYSVVVSVDPNSPNYSSIAYIISHTTVDNAIDSNQGLNPAQAASNTPQGYYYRISTPQNNVVVSFTIGITNNGQQDTQQWTVYVSGSSSAPTTQASSTVGPTTSSSTSPTSPQSNTGPTTASSSTTGPTTSSSTTPVSSNYLTWGNNLLRNSFLTNTGFNLDNAGKVKLLASITLTTGSNNVAYYATPVVLNGKALAADARNTVSLVDLSTLKLVKQINLGLAVNQAQDIPFCGDTSPYIGVVSTPVIDPVTSIVYISYRSYLPGTSSGLNNTVQYLTALDFNTLTTRSDLGYPIILRATYTSPAGLTVDFASSQSTQIQRPALTLLNGIVYVGFAGMCDNSSPWLTDAQLEGTPSQGYRGWVIGVSASTAVVVQAWANCVINNYYEGGLWQSGAGLSSDDPSRMFVSAGNAEGSPYVNGQPQSGKNNPNANCVLEGGLSFSTSTLTPIDFYVTGNAKNLADADRDFSGGVTLTGFDNLAIMNSKEGNVYVLDMNNMGGYQTGGSNFTLNRNRTGAVYADGIKQILPVSSSGIWGAVAAWPLKKLIYVAPVGQPILAYQWDVASQTFQYAGRSNGPPCSYGCSTPQITTTSADDVKAVIWWYSNNALTVYDATPNAQGVLMQLTAFTIVSTKFSLPSFASGRAITLSQSGTMNIFGNA